MLRETWPCRRETPFTPRREPHGGDGHVELVRAGRGGRRAGRSVSRSMPISSHTGPAHALELLDGEGVVPRRHRRVGGEDAVGPDLAHGVVERMPLRRRSSRSRSTIMNAACPSLACHTAGSMPMARSTRTPPTPRIHSCRSRMLGPAGVELVHQAAVVRVVHLEVGVEQVDRHPAHHHAPGADVHRAAGGLDGGEERLAAWRRSPAPAA